MSNRSGNGPNLMYKCHKIVMNEGWMMNGVILINGLIFLIVLHLLLVMNGLNTFQNSRLSQLNQRFVTRYSGFISFGALSRNSIFAGSGMIFLRFMIWRILCFTIWRIWSFLIWRKKKFSQPSSWHGAWRFSWVWLWAFLSIQTFTSRDPISNI